MCNNVALVRNGWMLHFLHLFHDKFSLTLSILQTLTFLQILQNNLLHTSWLFLTWNGWDHKYVRILFSNTGIIFIWDILCEPHIYHMKANFSSCTCIWLWLVSWSDMELSTWGYVSSLKFPILQLFKTLDFQTSDA